MNEVEFQSPVKNHHSQRSDRVTFAKQDKVKELDVNSFSILIYKFLGNVETYVQLAVRSHFSQSFFDKNENEKLDLIRQFSELSRLFSFFELNEDLIGDEFGSEDTLRIEMNLILFGAKLILDQPAIITFDPSKLSKTSKIQYENTKKSSDLIIRIKDKIERNHKNLDFCLSNGLHFLFYAFFFNIVNDKNKRTKPQFSFLVI